MQSPDSSRFDRVLVTGGAGFIGSHLTELLVEEGSTVYVIDDLSTGEEALVPDGVTLETVDIRDSEKLGQMVHSIDPTAIVHLAAMHFVPECNENPERTFDINVMGTRNLLSAARTLDNLESFVYASSAAVYPPKATPLAETETPGPLDVYGRTKLVGEDLVDLFHRDTGVDTVSARLFNVFGPRETNPHLIPEIVEQIASSSRIELGNLTPKRDYVHVTDVARALHRMLDVEGQRTYNVGTGEAHSVRRVAELATNTVTEEFSVEQSQDRVRESDRKNLQADIDRIRGELRWEPRVSLESGLEALLTDHGVR